MSFTTINPSNGEVIKEYEELTPLQIDAAIIKSQEAFKQWKSVPFGKRADMLMNAARILRQNKLEYGSLMALEMGKPLQQGISEADKCAWACEYYAENAEQQLEDIPIQTDASESFVSFKPIGPVLAIMPWNFPFWQVFRFAAPALMVGNSGLLKHSRNTMGCALKIEEIFLMAGFPEGLFQSLVIGSEPVASIIRHSLIAAVTITGSTPAGAEVASIAGSQIKKTVLELGGSDPYIVLEDADLDKTAETCVNSRLINSGQSCIAAKRFIVVEKVIDEFTDLFVKKMKLRKMDDPFVEGVHLGPQARKDLQLDLQRQVNESVKQGAEVVIGGELPAGKGFFYPPSVLIGVRKGMTAYKEEVFGPVAAIIPAKDEKEAIEIANDTNFGLGASIFTQDVQKGKRIASDEIQSGSCFVNEFVKSDPRLPFGGVKMSGYGRELSTFGIREFVNIKTVYIK
jgi:succinate-semialdehyde dehydrogenase/glutarate-semialdehyde dehydrogenase